jgi:hypothetical protein
MIQVAMATIRKPMIRPVQRWRLCRAGASRLSFMRYPPCASTNGAALDDKRGLKVLALGQPSASEVVGGTGLAPYPVRLEKELEKALPGIDVNVEGRSLPGEITTQAIGAT